MRGSAHLQRWVMLQWLRKGWFSITLQPLSWLAQRAVLRKRQDYATGRRHATRVDVPVVVVGNVFVGGTGKTPVVIALAHALTANGRTPGIISRGYGVQAGDTPRLGQHDLDPALFGDEPALIARATGAPIAVHPKRGAAAVALLKAYPKIDVLVSDDGLQHLALARDIEIIVQDERGVGNGHMLPAGPLREPASRLDTVDVVITNRGAGSSPAVCTPPGHAGPQASAAKADFDVPPSAGPTRVDMCLRPGVAVHVVSGHRVALQALAAQSEGQRIAAAAGIGQPQRFFDMLSQHGLTVSTTLPLPDHYDFSRSPFDGLAADVILITSKDSVKCRKFEDQRLWEIPIEAEFSPDVFPRVVIDALFSPGLPARHADARAALGPA